MHASPIIYVRQRKTNFLRCWSQGNRDIQVAGILNKTSQRINTPILSLLPHLSWGWCTNLDQIGATGWQLSSCWRLCSHTAILSYLTPDYQVTYFDNGIQQPGTPHDNMKRSWPLHADRWKFNAPVGKHGGQDFAGFYMPHLSSC